MKESCRGMNLVVQSLEASPTRSSEALVGVQGGMPVIL
jgi:hypothetical protein